MIGQLDDVLTAWINQPAGTVPLLDALMVAAAGVGIPLMVLAVAGQWWVTADRRATRHVLLAAGMSFLLGLALNQVVLLAVHRMRPYDGGISHLLIAPSADFSFPSDHATAAFAIAATFLLHGLPRRGLGFLAAAVLVAAARVYVGIHYVGDVLGGAATGLAAACLVRLAYRPDTRFDRLLTSIL